MPHYAWEHGRIKPGKVNERYGILCCEGPKHVHACRLIRCSALTAMKGTKVCAGHAHGRARSSVDGRNKGAHETVPLCASAISAFGSIQPMVHAHSLDPPSAGSSSVVWGADTVRHPISRQVGATRDGSLRNTASDRRPSAKCRFFFFGCFFPPPPTSFKAFLCGAGSWHSKGRLPHRVLARQIWQRGKGHVSATIPTRRCCQPSMRAYFEPDFFCPASASSAVACVG